MNKEPRIQGFPYGEICPLHPELDGMRCRGAPEICFGCYTPAMAKAEVAEARKLNKTARQEARERGDKFYKGKLCYSHPELAGERYASTGACVGCMCSPRALLPEMIDRRRGGPEEFLHRAMRKHALERGEPRFNGKICKRHPDLNGRRYTRNNLCVACALEAVKRSQARKAKASESDER